MQKNLNIDVIREIGLDGKESLLIFHYNLTNNVDDIEIGSFSVDKDGYLIGELNQELLLYNSDLKNKAKNIIYNNGLKQILDLDTRKNLFDINDSINIKYSLDCDVNRWNRTKKFIDDNNLEVSTLDDTEILVELAISGQFDDDWKKSKIKE